jgi:hypothetical protein
LLDTIVFLRKLRTQQLDEKLQDGVGGDEIRDRMVAIREMRAHSDAPFTTDAHSFDAIFEPRHNTALAKAKLIPLVGLHDVSPVQGERVRHFDVGAMANRWTASDHEIFKLNAAASTLHGNGV